MRAQTPEDLTRLFVERANAGDAAGIAELYEPEAVMAYPPARSRRAATRSARCGSRRWLRRRRFEPEEPLPTLISGDLALTTTIARDGAGVRAQVVRRQADGTWLRLLDQPEIGPPVQP